MARKAIVLAASALLMLTCAPSAGAGSGLVIKGPGKWGGHGHEQAGAIQERSASASATGREAIVSATATCPKKTRVAGGGFSAPSSIAVIGLVYESVKVGQRSWRASAQLLDLGAPSTLTLTTFVYCRAHFPHTHMSSSTVQTTGRPQVGPSGSATCKRGTEALAGGFTMPPPLHGATVSSIFFDSLRSSPISWDARVVTGPNGPSNFTTEAYCSKKIQPPSQTGATSAPSNSDFTVSTVSATCSEGLAPATGGFEQPQSDLASFFIVFESRRIGASWQVSGMHSGFNPPVTLSAYGYCA
jgi:hypothetical protein